jgi:hypothetical protein
MIEEKTALQKEKTLDKIIKETKEGRIKWKSEGRKDQIMQEDRIMPAIATCGNTQLKIDMDAAVISLEIFYGDKSIELETGFLGFSWFKPHWKGKLRYLYRFVSDSLFLRRQEEKKEKEEKEIEIMKEV